MNALKKLANVDFVVAGAALLGLVLLTVIGVVMRYAVKSPLTWLEEIQMLLIIWTTFFGGAAAFRNGGHVAIEILVDALPANCKKAVSPIIFLVVSFILLYVGYQGINFIMRLASAGRATNILRIPYAFIYAAIPVGAALMLLNYWASLLGARNENGGAEA